MKTFVEKLTIELDKIKQTMFDLLDNSRIVIHHDDPSSNFIIIAPSNYWDKASAKEELYQIELKKLYNPWIESFKLFTFNSPEETQTEIDQTDEFIKNWIEKKSDWGIPKTITEAKIKFEEEIEFFYKTLQTYSNSESKEIIVIPDTNAIIQEPEPKNYKKLLGLNVITIAFLPTVLSELDELKIKSANSSFKEKVKSVIKRLKGYRKQGNLIEGVTVEKSITIKMIAPEPNFEKTLSWLDSGNNDDRIIASALEIQREKPSSIVCLVTSDINLQNKAEMARLSYLDVD